MSGSIVSLILVAAAAAVVAIYKLEVIRDLLAGPMGRQKQKSMEVQLQRGLGRASDLRAEQARLANEAKRRVQPLLLDTIRAVEAPNGTVTVLAKNAGGFATDVTATSPHCTMHITPTTIDPDAEVQLTFIAPGSDGHRGSSPDGNAPGNAAPDSSAPGDSKSDLDVTIAYLSAYGQPDEIRIAYVRATQELKPR